MDARSLGEPAAVGTAGNDAAGAVHPLGDPPMLRGIRQAIAATVAGKVVTPSPKRTRLHAVMAPVAQPLAANVAAALSIDVSMTSDAREVGDMVDHADGLLVNLGMLDGPRREGIVVAVERGVPYVLDPVKVDRSPDRLAFARRLLMHRPAVVKGNAAEMAALGPLPEGTVAVTTGETDLVESDAARLVLANGSDLLDKVIATGCATGLLVAAKLAEGAEPFVAAAAGVSHMNLAAEHAAVDRFGSGTSVGPGTFAAHLLDELTKLSADAVIRELAIVREDFDLSLYLILGPEVADPVALVREAVAGGVTLVQWRDKAGATADQIAAVRRLVQHAGVPVIVNDRVDVAAVAGADGVHVGHGDLTPGEARGVAELPVGVTIHSVEEADEMARHAYDYASVGGVFATTSKHNPSPPIGIDGFAQLAQHLRRQRRGRPICAVAGIDAQRAKELVRAGADGVAVMSAITKAPDPRAAAGMLRAAIEEARQ